MNLKVEIASVTDRDELVAEIWLQDEMVAEIRHATGGRILLDIYSSPNNEPWSFELEHWITVLTEAQRRLG